MVDEFTDKDLKVLLETAIKNNLFHNDPVSSHYWTVELFKNYLKMQNKRFPCLNMPFKDLPLHIGKNIWGYYPAEAFNQMILNWRLQIGK